MPPFMNNKGCYTLSLGNFCRWLAAQAEALGVEIFPGFAAAEVLFDEAGAVKGVATGDMGVAKDGTHKDSYTPGLELHAKYTFFAEGVRGHLSKELIRLFNLNKGVQPQVYGIGIKELWDIDPAKHVAGRVIHTQGWPLDDATGGGGFLYHQANHQVALGFVTWLNYSNPYLSPFDEMQRWKTHPAIRRHPRGRTAGQLWRAGDQRRRLAERAEADLPRRRADRVQRRLRQRAADQGQPHRDEDRHDGRRRRRRRDRVTAVGG